MNRAVYDSNGVCPPLMNDVFKTYKRIVRFADAPINPNEKAAIAFAAQVFNIAEPQIANHDVNFEKVVDAAIKLREDAQNAADEKFAAEVYWGLISIIARTVDTAGFHAHWSETISQLGRIMVNERARIITFNYDTILEWALWTGALGATNLRHDVPTGGESILSSGRVSNWSPRAAYGVKFDYMEVGTFDGRVGDPGCGSALTNPVDVPLMKMHGSLNWFTYTGIRPAGWPPIEGQTSAEELKGKSLLLDTPLWKTTWPIHNGVILSPTIVTPSKLKAEQTKLSPFREIWEAAARALSACKRLVVIGYSFQDEHTVKFIQEHVDFSGLEEVGFVLPSRRWADELCKQFGFPDRHTERGWYLPSVEQYSWIYPVGDGPVPNIPYSPRI